MKYKVVIASEGATNPSADEALADIGASMVEAPSQLESDLIQCCRDADAVLVGANEQFNARVINSLEKCRVLSRLGIGYNNIDVGAATARGIPVSIVPDYCVSEVSDHAIALLLSFARQLGPLHRAASTGGWRIGNAAIIELRERLHRLSTQTLGIIGLGRIGRAVAAKGQVFGFRVIAFDPYLSPKDAGVTGVELVDFETLLRESDFVTLHAAMDKSTFHLIDLPALEKMKPTAYLINTSRGGLIDEAALYKALTEGIIAGAGIDVTDPEPPKADNPLLTLDNLLVTAHSSYYSKEAAVELWQRGVEAVVTVFKGGMPRYLANPDVVPVAR